MLLLLTTAVLTEVELLVSALVALDEFGGVVVGTVGLLAPAPFARFAVLPTGCALAAPAAATVPPSPPSLELGGTVICLILTP